MNALRTEWTNSLELHVPESMNIEPKAYQSFNNKNSLKLKELEQFCNIFLDWVNEIIRDLPEAAQPPKASEPS